MREGKEGLKKRKRDVEGRRNPENRITVNITIDATLKVWSGRRKCVIADIPGI